MSKEEKKEEQEPHVIQTNSDTWYFAFKALTLCQIDMLSSEQTKDLMHAISDYVWRRESKDFLMEQLDTATKVLFWEIANDIDDAEILLNR